MPFFPPPSLMRGRVIRPRIICTLRSCALTHLRHAIPETGQTASPAILPYAQRSVNGYVASPCDTALWCEQQQIGVSACQPVYTRAINCDKLSKRRLGKETTCC